MSSGFFESSQNVQLKGSILSAQCPDTSGNLHASSIDTNNLLGNNNGQFSHPGSGWFNSAESSSLDGKILQAQLIVAGGGSTQFASFNLDGIISNNGGVLTS